MTNIVSTFYHLGKQNMSGQQLYSHMTAALLPLIRPRFKTQYR